MERLPPWHAEPTVLRYRAILKITHMGGDDGAKQWRTFDPPLSNNAIKLQKIKPYNYEGYEYTVPAAIPEETLGLYILDLRGRFWDRRVEMRPGHREGTIMAHAAWFCPMVPKLIQAGLKPVVLCERSLSRWIGTMACYEALAFRKETDLVLAAAVLDGCLPPD